MSKIIVDELQKSGGESFGLPTTKGIAGSVLTSDGLGATAFDTPNFGPGIAWDKVNHGGVSEVAHFFEAPRESIVGLKIDYNNVRPSSNDRLLIWGMSADGSSNYNTWMSIWNGTYSNASTQSSYDAGQDFGYITANNHYVNSSDVYSTGVTGSSVISFNAADSNYPRMQVMSELTHSKNTGNDDIMGYKSLCSWYGRSSPNLSTSTPVAGIKFTWQSGSTFDLGNIAITEMTR